MMWNEYGQGHDGGWSMMSGGGGLFALVFMLLLVALLATLIVATVVAIRRLGPTSGEPRLVGGSAQRLLGDRFARGEIDEEEYRRSRAVLLEA